MAEPSYSFTCKEHAFTTASTRKASEHMRADIVDGVFGFGAAIARAALGIEPQSRPPGRRGPPTSPLSLVQASDPGFCHCWALPYPHYHNRVPGAIVL